MKRYFCAGFVVRGPVQLPCAARRGYVRPHPGLSGAGTECYIVNTDTNIIVYDKDSTKQVSAGGLTKYMTIALLLTNYADHLDDTFQMPFAISDYVYNTNNRRYALQRDLYLREAMYAMLTRNANEAAHGPCLMPFPGRRPRRAG